MNYDRVFINHKAREILTDNKESKESRKVDNALAYLLMFFVLLIIVEILKRFL